MMSRLWRCNADVHAELRYPSGTAIDTAVEEARAWGEQFPGSRVRLKVGDKYIIEMRFPRRQRGRISTDVLRRIMGLLRRKPKPERQSGLVIPTVPEAPPSPKVIPPDAYRPERMPPPPPPKK